MKGRQNDEDLLARRLLHTTVYDQCFSPCGKFLVAANNFGFIAVFSLGAVLLPDATEESRKPVYCFKASQGAIYCLTSTDTLLISAGDGDIRAWKWADITSKAPKLCWSIKIPVVKQFSNPEVNSLVVNSLEDGSKLLGGCGDNLVYVWDLATGQETVSLSGHTDYIHCVALKNGGSECVSASEDGSVRIWDLRASGEAVHIIEPWKSELAARPEMGKWVGCVAVDQGNDWLVCRGGPLLTSWHLRSLMPTTAFNTPGSAQNCVMFYEDTVISAGGKREVNHWFMNGDLKAQVPCSPNTVFNVAINTKSDTMKVLSVAGNSASIDVCTNFSYKAFSLTFATNEVVSAGDQ